MTIKSFARLCGCNPQTLRYYDRVGLLCPARVDEWSGYRYYEEEQAMTYVKIKSLQNAGFTLEEIKALLNAENEVIFGAFEEKIRETEERLQNLRREQASYQTEMSRMKKTVEEVRELVARALENYDPVEEFGVGRETYQKLTDRVNAYFEEFASSIGELDFQDFQQSEGDVKEEQTDFLQDPNCELLWERHGWTHMREIMGDFPPLEDRGDYAMLVHRDGTPESFTGFCNTLLGVLLEREPQKKLSLSVNLEKTADGSNHFWLFRRKS